MWMYCVYMRMVISAAIAHKQQKSECVRNEVRQRKLDREINDIRRIAHNSTLLLSAVLCSSSTRLSGRLFLNPGLSKGFTINCQNVVTFVTPSQSVQNCIDVCTNVTRIRDPLNSQARVQIFSPKCSFMHPYLSQIKKRVEIPQIFKMFGHNKYHIDYW